MKSRFLLITLIFVLYFSKTFGQESSQIQIQCPDFYYSEECWDVNAPQLISNYDEFIEMGGSAYSDCGIIKESFTVIMAGSGYQEESEMMDYYQDFSISDSCGNIAYCTFNFMRQAEFVIPDDKYINYKCGSAFDVSELTGLTYSETTMNIPLEMFLDAGGKISSRCDSMLYTDCIIEYFDEEINPEYACQKNFVRHYHFINPFNDYEFSGDQSIQFLDNQPPVVENPPNSLVYREIDVPTFETYDEFIAAGGKASDNCGIDKERFKYSGTYTEGNCPKVKTRFYAVFDWCGNLTLAQHSTTIVDTTPPVSYNSNDYTVQCKSDVRPATSSIEELTLDHVYFSGEVVDSTFHLAIEISEGNCPQVITRIYEVSDLCGNIGTHKQTITVNDTEPPVFLIQPNEIQDLEFGSELPPFEALEYTDNCGTPDLTTSVLPYTEDENGYEVTYLWKLTDSCGNTAETSTSFNVLPKPVDYCFSSGIANNEWIKSVTIGSETNISGTDGYKDYSNEFAFNVESGSSYGITLVPDFSKKATFLYWRVWIDLNADGEFSSGELMFSADKKRSTVTGLISIPTGIELETRMRIAMNDNGNPPSCNNVGNGEVEDYLVRVHTAEPQSPVAAFSSDKTTVSVGETVQFYNESLNNPLSLSWTFEGGSPLSSTSPNPVVVYNTAGTYDVTLNAINEVGTDSNTKIDFITVTDEPVLSYCESAGLSAGKEWISSISVGEFTNTSGSSTYSDFTGLSVPLVPGTSEQIILVPDFGKKSLRECWTVWIDFNQDSDFDDDGEEVLSIANSKTTEYGNISIPVTAELGTTRMRVSMKASAFASSCETFDRGEVEDYSVEIANNKSARIENGAKSEESELLVYPNPAHEVLNINYEAAINSKLKVFDAHGSLLLEKVMISDDEKLDIRNFATGMYYLAIENEKDNLRVKFIKQ